MYDEANDRIRVDAQYTSSITGQLEIAIDSTEDSVTIGDDAGNHATTTTVGPDVGLDVNVINSSLPSGAATEATLSAFKTANHSDLLTIQGKQDTGNTSLAEIALDTDNLDIPLSSRASETTLLSTNTKLDTANSSLSSINGKLVDDYGSSLAALRTAAQIGNFSGPADFGAGTTSAQTVRVVLPTDQTSIPATQSGTWNINNISGTISLPTGAATAARQDTGNTSLASIDTKLTDKSQFTKITDGTDTALVTAAGELNVLATAQPGVDVGDVTINNAAGASAVNIQDGGNSITVDGTVSAAQSGTWNINNISGTISLPTGAATETTLAKLTQTQASSTSGQSGPLVQGAVTTAAPTYTTGQTDPLSLTTSGALRVDNSGVTQPVSGTVAVTQSTSPWVNNISQFGGSNVVTGTGNSGAGIPRVTVSNDSSITNISGTISLPTGAATETSLAKLTQTQGSTTSGQSGPLVQGAVTTADPTYTTAQTDPLSLTTTGRLRSDVTGNVASAATDSGNPVKIGGITNSDGSLFTNGQRANAQMNLAGSIYTDSTGRTLSYSAFSSFTIAANSTDIFTLTGSATKTIKIRSVTVSGTNTGNTNALVFFVKRSTANTGGTSSNLTEVPHDSNNAAASGTALSYTANPTTGTLVGNLYGRLMFLPALASSNVRSEFEMNYGQDGAQPIVLRGTSEVFAVNMNGVAITGTTVMNIRITWTEE